MWKVELAAGGLVAVLEARRGSELRIGGLEDFMIGCAGYFADGGCIIDQPFQERLRDGMIRCYMATNRVVGFGQQYIKALLPPPPEGANSPSAQPGPRIMHPASAPAFRALRSKMESEWTPQMMQRLGIGHDALPIIWDADFLYGPRTADGEDTFVLCEINVSSVMPIPDQAPAEIARCAWERLLQSAMPAPHPERQIDAGPRVDPGRLEHFYPDSAGPPRHCEARSDEASPIRVPPSREIAFPSQARGPLRSLQ